MQMGLRLLIILSMMQIACSSTAQLRVSTLVIHPGNTFVLEHPEGLVADSLIFKDSSCLRLNRRTPVNKIHARVIVVGNNCSIDGRGLNGTRGVNGLNGSTPDGPCADGKHGKSGGKGTDGTSGINLFLSLDEIHLKGKLVIDLSGGNGGRGGNGGDGGGGNTGTIHCHGGDGGDGGDAGRGGNGANGGSLTLHCQRNPSVKTLIGSQIIVHTHAGLPGVAGTAGKRGLAGLGPGKRHGRNGKNGDEAPGALAGTNGKIDFVKN